MSRSALAAAIAVGLLVAGGGRAEQPAEQPPRPPADCPTFFPDFSCDRHGRYEGFIQPTSAPYLFEDPFITTGLYGWGVWHQFPNNSVFQGGHLYSAALQIRVAITDRLAFIATKDGFTHVDPDIGIVDPSNGWMNLAGGLKYALIDMPEKNFILSPSLRIEVPTGSHSVYQGHGDGIMLPAISWAWGIEDVHFMGDVGAQIPIAGAKNSTLIFWNLHWDWRPIAWFAPFVELNALQYVGGGNGKIRIDTDLGNLTLNQVQGALGTGGFEGVDLINLGSRNVNGHDVFTLAVGARFPITRHVSMGASYEFPVSTRKDLFRQRVTTSLTFEY